MLRGIIILLFVGFSSAVDIISVPVGSSFTVPCLGQPDEELLFPTYTWTFLPKENPDDLSPKHEIKLSGTESELSFTPLKTQHAGLYTCVAMGESNKGLMKLKRKFKLTVQDAPVLTKWFFVIVDEGDTAWLPCSPDLQTAANTSYANSIWSRGNSTRYVQLTPIQATSDENGNETAANRISWAAGPDEGNWGILIADVKPEDRDIYLCGVTVGTEKHMVKVELSVNAAPPPRCLSQTEPWEECPDPDSRSGKAILGESITAFSTHLYSKLRSTQLDTNLLISPISIAGLLSHLLLGARGETRVELEKALSLPIDFSCIHSEMKNMRETMKESLQMASQMFYNPKHEIGEAFLNQSLEFYDMVPKKLTDSSEENVKMINKWVEEKTQRKITELVESVDPLTEFILLNAVYFIGKWKWPFEENMKKGEFLTLSGKVVSVPSLYSSKFNLVTKYMTKLKAQVAKFPLTGESTLYVLVPNSVTEKALAQLEENLNDNNLRAMVIEMGKITPMAAEVTLPKTKLAISTDLASILKKIGLSDLFDSPNLCPVFSEESVALTGGRHRAFFSLTEQGVEAAAASSVSFSRSFNTFSAMQPFVFIVWSEQTACPLFMGRIADPTREDGEIEKKNKGGKKRGREREILE